ncbi:hypothetical protein P43SY_005162 [Pythium insidiosum]|uniref:Myb-like DNA-binding protein n=1 Tax=Pythium insidiosum TaxID=114742 RepID=A0AAD5M5T0_PYTIN|nr:hypothetical protein P43SY_005162 [Pythium insidiosum]
MTSLGSTTPTAARPTAPTSPCSFDEDGLPIARGIWSTEEHERFLDAMKMYPQGPWRLIAEHIGTRSIKQVQTHAQKYQQKVFRQQRGLRKKKKRVARPEHRVDTSTTGSIVRKLRLERASGLESPRSPSGFSRMMAIDARITAEEIRLAVALEQIDPLPFTPVSQATNLLQWDAAFERDLHESLMMFLDDA